MSRGDTVQSHQVRRNLSKSDALISMNRDLPTIVHESNYAIALNQGLGYADVTQSISPAVPTYRTCKTEHSVLQMAHFGGHVF